jgi:hypothetical protein
MPRYHGQFDRWKISLDYVKVGPANATSLNLHQHLGIYRNGLIDFLNPKRAVGDWSLFVQYRGSHMTSYQL